MQHLTIIHAPQKQLIANATSVIEAHGIDILDFDSFTEGDQQYLRLGLSDTDKGLEVLTEAGFQVITEDTVLMKIEDKAGALARLSQQINDAGINLRGISLISNQYGFGTVAISTNDNEQVRALFREHLIN